MTVFCAMLLYSICMNTTGCGSERTMLILGQTRSCYYRVSMSISG